MVYVAIKSTTTPLPGCAKRLYSPQLLDPATGVYGANPTNAHQYELDSAGKFQFYEESEVYASPASVGKIQAKLAVNPSLPDTTYWQGTFQIIKASDRSVVLSGVVIKGSQNYMYIPGYVSPYVEVSRIVYTDSTAPNYSDGGQQMSTDIPALDYIAVFEIVKKFSTALPGPPVTFTETDVTAITTMEIPVTVTAGAVSVVTFTL